MVQHHTFFVWLCVLTLLTLSVPCTSQAATKPNVLFMCIDDLNDWTGCLGGHPDVKTPNLDRLAGRGILFRNAFCAAPACNPSRAALMTGIRPSTSGVYHNSQPWRLSPRRHIRFPAPGPGRRRRCQPSAR